MVFHLETVSECILCGSPKIKIISDKKRICRCLECGHLFDSPRPDLDSIARFYSRQGKYDMCAAEPEPMHQYWLKKRDYLCGLAIKGSKLLDVGAGVGTFLKEVTHHFDCTGTELSDEGVKVAKDRFGLNLMCGPFEDVVLDKASFDVVTMFQTMEHFLWPKKTIEKVSLLIKTGGLLHISLPNEAPYSMRRIIPSILGKIGVKKYRRFAELGISALNPNEIDEIHLSHFSPTALCKVLRQNGFEILDSGPDFLDPFTNSPSILIQFLRRVLFVISKIINGLSGKIIYNCFYVTARKI